MSTLRFHPLQHARACIGIAQCFPFLTAISNRCHPRAVVAVPVAGNGVEAITDGRLVGTRLGSKAAPVSLVFSRH